jgi:hypothetical protein
MLLLTSTHKYTLSKNEVIKDWYASLKDKSVDQEIMYPT